MTDYSNVETINKKDHWIKQAVEIVNNANSSDILNIDDLLDRSSLVQITFDSCRWNNSCKILWKRWNYTKLSAKLFNEDSVKSTTTKIGRLCPLC